jgi:hypothetical protein
MSKRSAAFGTALRAVHQWLGLTKVAFAARLGVSTRTILRWEDYDELPPVPQRTRLALSFPDVPVQLRAALARAMELDEAFVLTHAAPPLPPIDAPPPAPPPGLSLEATRALLEPFPPPTARAEPQQTF